MDLPHFHVSACFGLDNYAWDWLGLSPYQLADKGEKGKTPAQAFNDRYKDLGLRYGRMMTIRYTSYKTGYFQVFYNGIREATTREIGYEPDLIQQSMASVAVRLHEIREKYPDLDIKLYSIQENSDNAELSIKILDALTDYLFSTLRKFATEEEKVAFLDVYNDLQELDKIANKIEQETKVRFDQICRMYFGLSAQEFQHAYDRRLNWLIEQHDQALVDMAKHFGFSALMEKNIWDKGLSRALRLDDFPPNAVVLEQDDEDRPKGPSRMVVGYPVENPLEDIPSISIVQFIEAVNNISKNSNGLVFVSTDPQLEQLKEQYITSQLKYALQYQHVRSEDIVAGAVDLRSINDSTEVVLISAPEDIDIGHHAEVQTFILEAWEKLKREGRRTNLAPKVIVFSPHSQDLTKWIPEGSTQAHFKSAGREIEVQES